ncbi:hypothetical protein KSAC_21690 [Komagataeibacter saccharivorans]|nr:hypothetical protein KSAC_21690 [Komagataeibacter saccharivorans]
MAGCRAPNSEKIDASFFSVILIAASIGYIKT